MKLDSRVGAIALQQGTSWLDYAIRWQTDALWDDAYSHAMLVLPGGKEVIESANGAGVRTRIPTEAQWSQTDTYAITFDTKTIISPEQWAPMESWARVQLANKVKYDWFGDIRFLTRWTGGLDGKLFCSEFDFLAVEQSGIKLLNNREAWEVSPSLLGTSALLKLLASKTSPATLWEN